MALEPVLDDDHSEGYAPTSGGPAGWRLPDGHGGVILGGLSENLSLVVGFNHLLFLAVAYYLLSA